MKESGENRSQDWTNFAATPGGPKPSQALGQLSIGEIV